MMDPFELKTWLDDYVAKNYPSAFVCTPETFRKINQTITPRPQDLYLGGSLSLDMFTGVPIRIEDDPQLQPGEALLEFDDDK